MESSPQTSSISALEETHQELRAWCRLNHYAGYDPFDALNSRAFQVTPLKHWPTGRLLWTQFLKRAPVNLRPLALIPKERNAKGIALFALAALADFRRTGKATAERDARELLENLLAVKLNGWHGAAWGYNFDWQSRFFFVPRGNPTIVPTAFAARALLEASTTLSDDRYLDLARSVCDFILHDLPRTVNTESEVCFSYAPNTNTTIFNASLLAAETLAEVGSLTNEPDLQKLAMKAARFVVKQQKVDGSWAYGTDARQSRVDNFHTAFVLDSLARIDRFGLPPDPELSEAIKLGFAYWRSRFFLADGWPKYYDDSLYPADIHAAATAIATLADLNDRDPQALELAIRVAFWAIRNLRARRGYFYYQRYRFHTRRTPFMRWNQAWMMYGLARLLEELAEAP